MAFLLTFIFQKIFPNIRHKVARRKNPNINRLLWTKGIKLNNTRAKNMPIRIEISIKII